MLVTARPVQSAFSTPGWTLPVLNSAHGGKQGERIILIDHRTKKWYDPYDIKFARPLHPKMLKHLEMDCFGKTIVLAS